MSRQETYMLSINVVSDDGKYRKTVKLGDYKSYLMVSRLQILIKDIFALVQKDR